MAVVRGGGEGGNKGRGGGEKLRVYLRVFQSQVTRRPIVLEIFKA